jgi:GDP/UDP-N,N'-diacetylbacillosamine 2-epimerase (hydrolysing)|tara:strand:+ start:543 stop:1718 length:1176 start_codon:yes stop_codon:yes gene_type:complete
MKKKICVVTGSRAEFGLLTPLMEEFRHDIDILLQLIVTGMHLSSDYGSTYKEIEKENFEINEKIDISLTSDTAVGISKSTGLSIEGFARAYERLKPDIVVLLGDRFEILGAACAACICKVPIAHVNGGEVTRGAFDDCFRHSITKMSQLHFASVEEYRKRIIQLGEDPNRVFNVGALGVDNIKSTKLLTKEELEAKLNLRLKKYNLLVTFHPVTLENNTSEKHFQNLLDVLVGLEDTHIIFTKANADTSGRIINKMIDEYVSANDTKSIAITSMGQVMYLSTMQFVDAVVGNSSSGIIEAPSFKIGTINIGDRQNGRIRLGSIIDCRPLKDDIKEAFKRLYSENFQRGLRDIISPYGDGNAAKRISSIIKNYNTDAGLKKKFYDINFEIQV